MKICHKTGLWFIECNCRTVSGENRDSVVTKWNSMVRS